LGSAGYTKILCCFFRFRNFIHEQFNQHVESGKPVHDFSLNFNVGFLKPLIPRCIESALDVLHTPEMRMLLAQVFARHGVLEMCREPARVNIARAAANDTVRVPTEVEGDPTGRGGDSDSEDDM
jgi:hypothetical protein